MEVHNKFFKVFIYLWLIVIAILVLFPLVYTVSASFKTNMEILAHPERIFPQKPTFDNYIEAWNSGSISIKNMLGNSILYTVVCVFFTIATSAVSGYVFARGNFPGKKMIFAMFSSLLFITLGSISMYPYFEIVECLHFSKSLYSLMFIKAFGIPVSSIYLVKGFITGIPKELD